MSTSAGTFTCAMRGLQVMWPASFTISLSNTSSFKFEWVLLIPKPQRSKLYSGIPGSENLPHSRLGAGAKGQRWAETGCIFHMGTAARQKRNRPPGFLRMNTAYHLFLAGTFLVCLTHKHHFLPSSLKSTPGVWLLPISTSPDHHVFINHPSLFIYLAFCSCEDQTQGSVNARLYHRTTCSPYNPFLKTCTVFVTTQLSITFLVLVLIVWDYAFPIGSWCLEFEDSTGMYIVFLKHWDHVNIQQAINICKSHV